ncbi:hypothetical protein HZC27_00590 [Candidatus Roizmanbacteria bacterium]|nr:hypothetical protein [Candidatus Roizmanbacteria bacterium]
MLTIICGEDIVASRNYLSLLKSEFSKKGETITHLASQEVPDILKWQGDNLNLFTTKLIFITEHLEASIIRKRGKKSVKKSTVKTLEEIVLEIASRKDIELIDWEEKAGREIKLKDSSKVKEFKPSKSIFKLLESCSPGNLKLFVETLSVIAESQDDTFIFIMLYRHIRTLLLAQEGIFANTVQSWQKHNLASQAKLWQQSKLSDFYEGLYRIEVTSKSGTNPYGVKKALEILACYYL